MDTVLTTTDFKALQREDTQRRIIDAVNALLVEEHPATISVPAVAQRAGVSVPTIYRYFPTKERLLDASARSIDAQTRAWLGDDMPVPGDMLHQFIHKSWQELGSDLAAVRAQHMTGLGRELRRRRGGNRRRKAEGTTAGAGVDPTSPEGERLVRLILTVASSSVLLEQVDRLGLSIEDAADDVVWAIEAMIEAARRDQEAASPKRTRSPRSDTST